MVSPDEDEGEEEATESNVEEIQGVYEAFRSVQDLSDTARAFYTVTGEICPFSPVHNCDYTDPLTAELAGLRLETITRAVYMLEQKIIKWQRKKRRGEEQDAVAVSGV